MERLLSLSLLLAFLTAPPQGGQATVIRHGAILPTVCVANQEVFIRNSAGIYWCSAANTWTVVDAAVLGTSGQIVVTGGSGAVTLSLADPLTLGRIGSYAGATPTNGQLLIGSTANARFDKATLTGTSNQVNVTNGSSTITLALPQDIHTTATPQFSSLGLGVAAGAAGTLKLNSKLILYNNAAPSNGQLLIGNVGGTWDAAALTGTANRVTVTNGAGSITLSGPQDLDTGATPTFSNLVITSDISANTLAMDTAAPTVGANTVGYGGTVAATATNGGGEAMKANVDGYLIINVAGTQKKIPYVAD